MKYMKQWLYALCALALLSGIVWFAHIPAPSKIIVIPPIHDTAFDHQYTFGPLGLGVIYPGNKSVDIDSAGNMLVRMNPRDIEHETLGIHIERLATSTVFSVPNSTGGGALQKLHYDPQSHQWMRNDVPSCEVLYVLGAQNLPVYSLSQTPLDEFVILTNNGVLHVWETYSSNTLPADAANVYSTIKSNILLDAPMSAVSAQCPPEIK